MLQWAGAQREGELQEERPAAPVEGSQGSLSEVEELLEGRLLDWPKLLLGEREGAQEGLLERRQEAERLGEGCTVLELADSHWGQLHSPAGHLEGEGHHRVGEVAGTCNHQRLGPAEGNHRGQGLQEEGNHQGLDSRLALRRSQEEWEHQGVVRQRQEEGDMRVESSVRELLLGLRRVESWLRRRRLVGSDRRREVLGRPELLCPGWAER